MDNRTNVIFMMVLGAGIVALGSSLGAREIFQPHELKKQAYVVEGVEEEGGEGAAGAPEMPIAMRMQTAEEAKGAEVFKKCASCHTITQGGANGIGPNLWAALGKPHGHVPGFAYSDALKSVPGVWDFEGMDKWLKSPKAYAPGTKMSFAGLSKPEDRANVIAYLNSQGSNLPLPPPPAAGAAPADGAAPAAGAANGSAPATGSAPTGGSTTSESGGTPAQPVPAGGRAGGEARGSSSTQAK